MAERRITWAELEDRLKLKLGIYKFWTKKEEQFLRNNYIVKKNKELGKILNRSTSCISSRLMRLNLKRPKDKGIPSSNFWTKEKIEFLKNSYMVKGNIELGKIFNISPYRIHDKLRFLNLRRPKSKGQVLSSFWTENKVKFLRDNYMVKGNIELGEILGTTPSSIKYKLNHLNLKRPKGKGIFLSKYGFWTKNKIQFLKDNYLVKGNIELGKILNTTSFRISDKLKYLNLKRPKGKGFFLSLSFRPRNEKTRSKIRVARLRQVIPTKDTTIELALQEKLRKKGVSFEIHKPIFGQPDIFIEPNIAIFCDGDYWHSNPKIYRDVSKDLNATQKKNQKRDLEVNHTLLKKNYIVLRFWEYDIKNNMEECWDMIDKMIKVG